ncbi:beta-3-deoxy-D-manno-oct-2-ulosonic acid transferase [Aurantiacibacter xanthus]|uniref:Beta-3-deoxy-D-manno-oct-2-ulosonic acid transferase n=1 Tax=Aurantiacibacter xanthus TaxID=1784712 RepID=A0A3A1P6E3_9SPHN|nr:beta-3-deoxy-D-manno-oct-2-ulosonic acid transferase [Aurantiacibacter xanthus]RIV83499.1 beta-3-deoxy-D-manno-oct-2-ulosonic acid transferase [Aurantiacibacter xanthus]
MSHAPPLLRAPPFPWAQHAGAPANPAPDLAPADSDALLEAMRTARVGGAFWAAPCAPERLAETVLRPRNKAELPHLQTAYGASDVLDCPHDCDPWSILPQAKRLVAHGDDEWIAIAAILGVAVQVLSPGPYGAPADDEATLKATALTALAQPMRDPFSGNWLTPHEAIALLAEWRRVIDGNRGTSGQTIVAACGMSWWKRAEIRRFLWVPGTRLRIAHSGTSALAHAQRHGGAVAVWPSRISPRLIAQARERGVALVRVEDGFVRSAGLGSNLVPPSSVVVDRQGIHFDPSAPSDLETILAVTDFAPALIERARQLRKNIVAAGISKYARSSGARGKSDESLKRTRRVVLVPGQVEDDMSVLAGGGGLASNLELLKRARAREPEAEIWWRPHPDVDAGHRNGAVADEDALHYADRIVREGSMADLLDEVDALHVLTSLSGFEALLRGREVTCHGTPFFAGWGLTRDLGTVPDRRGRQLTLDELVAGVLLLYPRYLDPVTGLPCPPEVLIRRMAEGTMPNRQGWIEPLRRLQGRIVSRFQKRKAKAAQP